MLELIDWFDKKDVAATIFIIMEVIFAAHGSTKVQDMSFLLMCFGLTVSFLSIFVKLGRRGTFPFMQGE